MTGSTDLVPDLAREAFFAALERDPASPRAALDALGLPPAVLAAARELAVAYERGGRIEQELCGPGGDIEQALREVAVAADTPVDRSTPERIGHYALGRVLGRSARSAVFEAQQEWPIQRSVALKLLFEDAADDQLAARVELERQILATLEHPGIARIYDFGIDAASRPYLVMEFVRSGTIVGWCREQGLAIDERVRLFLQVVEAMRYAHARGVLHCDLKPANILVQEFEGTAHAKVIDFGIARAFGGALAERTSLVDLPSAVGTLLAMSPEALEPTGARLDVRADVFGLGLVLWEMLAGRPPRVMPDGGVGEALRIALDGEVPRLRDAAPSVPADLEAIVMRACAARPEARYETVAALGDDLQRFLRGEAVVARPRGLAERTARRAWRHRVAAGVVLAAVLASAPFAAARVRSERRFHETVAKAETALARAREVRDISGQGDRRSALLQEALECSRVALVMNPDDRAAIEIRASAVEEALLPRLARSEHKSLVTVEFANELVSLRERVVASAPREVRALERLSVALAYQLDTVRGTPAFGPLEARQLALDERLYRENPGDRVYADNLAWTYQRATVSAWSAGERARSIEYLRRAAELGDEVAKAAPDDAIAQLTGAAGAHNRAIERLVAGELADALAAAQTSIARARRTLELQRDHARAAAFLINSSVIACDILLELGDTEAASRLVDGSVAAVRRTVAQNKSEGLFGGTFADLLEAGIRTHMARGDAARVREFTEEFARFLDGHRDQIIPFTRYGYRLFEAELSRLWILLREGDAEGAASKWASLKARLRIPQDPESQPVENLEALIDYLGLIRRCAEGSAIAGEMRAEVDRWMAEVEQESSAADVGRLRIASWALQIGDFERAAAIAEATIEGPTTSTNEEIHARALLRRALVRRSP